MLVKSITGKTKDTVRVTKTIGGLLIVTDQLLAGMTGELAGVTNEEIGIQLESGQQQIKVVQPRMKISTIALMATLDEGVMLIESGRLFLYIPIARGASLAMDNDTEIVVSFDGLKSAKKYDVYGVELPGVTSEYYTYSHKKILAGRTSEQLNVTDCDVIAISSVNAIKNLELTKYTVDSAGNIQATNHEYESDEIKYLLSQTNDLVAAAADGSVIHSVHHNQLVLPVSTVTELELETDGTELDIIMRKPVL